MTRDSFGSQQRQRAAGLSIGWWQIPKFRGGPLLTIHAAARFVAVVRDKLG
jgi:hypothetical protein